MTYTDAELILMALFVISISLAISDGFCTLFYCIRMRSYERAILSAKDCKMLVVRPPFRLWKNFSVSEVSENAENIPRK